MIITLTIAGERLPSLNKFYAGMHHRERTLLKDQWHEAVWYALLEQFGVRIPEAARPVIITITAYAVRPVDPDNIMAKLVIDGLKQARLLADDTYQHVAEVRLRSRKADRQHGEGLIILIEDAI